MKTKQELVDGEYEVQIIRLDERTFVCENGVPVSKKMFYIVLMIREDCSENPAALRGKHIVDTVFCDDTGKYDSKKLSPLINAIPREEYSISFLTEEELLKYIYGACVRVNLQIKTTPRGKQRYVIQYMPTRAISEKKEVKK